MCFNDLGWVDVCVGVVLFVLMFFVVALVVYGWSHDDFVWVGCLLVC